MNDPSELPTDVPSRAVIFPLLGQVLVGLLVGLTAADYVVGQLDQERDLRKPGMLVANDELGWINSPGFAWNDSTISSLGLRNADVPADAPGHEVRILGVGASRTFGSGVFDTNDTWGPKLETLLGHALDGDFRVFNGGVNGYSALQSARRAMQLTPECDPDVILLFIAPGAQMMLDPSVAGDWARVEGSLIPSDVAEGTPDFLEPLALTLHNALLHSNLYTRYRAQSHGRAGRPVQLTRFTLTRAEVPELAARMYQKTVDEVRALVAFCKEHDIALRAVLMLEHYQMNSKLWKKWLRFGVTRDVGAPPLGTPLDEGVAVLGEMLREQGCTVWSFVPELERIGSDLKRFTTDDRHWSKTGHRIMASGLVQRLTEDGMIQEIVSKRRQSPRD